MLSVTPLIRFLVGSFLILLTATPSHAQLGGLFSKKGPKDIKDTLLLQEKSPSYKPKMGRLVDSLSIEAMDKSFIIKKGETFKMDKLGIEQRAGWVNPTSDFSKWFLERFREQSNFTVQVPSH
jgi:hypothetical protein